MISESFLTLLDDRIKPAGSRDPLGFQTIWVNLGRELVGDNLTTITSSIDNFIITLLACHYSFPEQDIDKKMDTFFKVEQLGAYFRVSYKKKYEKYETSIMGITQAEINFELDDIELGEGSQIFGKQKTSGLWGYYTSSLVKSKLIDEDKIVLTVTGKKIIQKFLQTFNIEPLIQKNNINKTTIIDNSNKFIKALNSVYDDVANEILNTDYKIYSDYAIPFFKTHEEHDYRTFYDWVVKKENEFSNKLKYIKSIDKSLWVISRVFDFCRSEDKISIENVVDEIKKSPINKIRPLESVESINVFIDYWNKQEYKDAIIEVLKMHDSAMENRKATDWIKSNNGILNVKVSSTKGLPSEIKEDDWQYNYFLYSYLNIAYQVWLQGNNNDK